MAAQDFGRHIGQGTRNRAGACERSDGLGRFVDHRLRQPPGQTEIEHFDQALWSDNDVGAFQVVMDDIAPMGVRQGAGNLNAVTQDGLHSQTRASNQRL